RTGDRAGAACGAADHVRRGHGPVVMGQLRIVNGGVSAVNEKWAGEGSSAPGTSRSRAIYHLVLDSGPVAARNTRHSGKVNPMLPRGERAPARRERRSVRGLVFAPFRVRPGDGNGTNSVCAGRDLHHIGRPWTEGELSCQML